MTTAPDDRIPSENIFTESVAAIHAMTTSLQAADAALTARLADFERHTSDELTFYELLGGQAHNENSST